MSSWHVVRLQSVSTLSVLTTATTTSSELLEHPSRVKRAVPGVSVRLLSVGVAVDSMPSAKLTSMRMGGGGGDDGGRVGGGDRGGDDGGGSDGGDDGGGTRGGGLSGGHEGGGIDGGGSDGDTYAVT